MSVQCLLALCLYSVGDGSIPQAIACPQDQDARTEGKERTEEDVHWITNRTFRVGLKKSSGGAISWIGEAGTERNLINAYDRGRLVQQSWYGKEDGSRWKEQSWRWNPVQGGDWQGKAATILVQRLEDDKAYIKSQPVHWASGTDLTDCVMEQMVTLFDEWIHVQYQFQYNGQQAHPAVHQEMPAFFVDAKLTTLSVYDGDTPWTDAPLSRFQPRFPNEYKSMTEHWAAYTDADDFGIGCFTPHADELTCYRYGSDPSLPSSCSYFAPIRTLAVKPGGQFTYQVWISIGSIDQIRARFSRIARTLPSPAPQ